MSQAHPLAWPDSWPRTESHRRRRAPFGQKDGRGVKQHLTMGGAVKRLFEQLDLLGAEDVTISSNVEIRQDGIPRTGRRTPDDPGVAVYFSLEDRPYCMPCDRWDRVADNIAAVAKHIEAMRGMDRWGVGSTERAFAGYAALPSPDSATKLDWWVVLGVSRDAGLGTINTAYRRLAAENHPDRGGSHSGMAELNRARDAALRAVDHG